MSLHPTLSLSLRLTSVCHQDFSDGRRGKKDRVAKYGEAREGFIFMRL